MYGLLYPDTAERLRLGRRAPICIEKNWLPLLDALRNFVFDPTPEVLALVHGLRADPLRGIRAL